MKGLSNKRVVFTGSTSGIGAATAERFLEEGSRVVVIDFDEVGDRNLHQNILISGYIDSSGLAAEEGRNLHSSPGKKNQHSEGNAHESRFTVNGRSSVIISWAVLCLKRNPKASSILLSPVLLMWIKDEVLEISLTNQVYSPGCTAF